MKSAMRKNPIERISCAVQNNAIPLIIIAFKDDIKKTIISMLITLKLKNEKMSYGNNERQSFSLCK